MQSDAENRRLGNTILVMITGNLSDLGHPTTLLVDPTTADGGTSGLAGPSLVKCHNLATVRQSRVLRTIGHMPDTLLKKLNECLKATLDIS